MSRHNIRQVACRRRVSGGGWIYSNRPWREQITIRMRGHELHENPAKPGADWPPSETLAWLFQMDHKPKTWLKLTRAKTPPTGKTAPNTRG